MMENVSLTSEEHHNCSNTSKIKHLTDDINQKNLSSYSSALHVPRMSEQSLKRWSDVRDTYLGHQYPYIQKHQRLRPKNKTIKNEDISSIFTVESDQCSLFEQQQQQQAQKLHIDYDHFEDKCIETDIEQIDQGNQTDLLSLQSETHYEYDEKNQQIQFDQEPIEYSDKTTETDLILNIKKTNEVTRKNIETTIFDSIPNVSNQIMPLNDSIIDKTINDDDDTKTILSSTESNTSISEHLQKLRIRFKRLSKERRLLSCLLALYIIIMCVLLVVIFILLWTLHGRSLIIYEEITMTTTSLIVGVAQYGESCVNDNVCKPPFVCYKKKLASSGTCRCPLKYDFVNNQCIGDINAICTKDTDCQQYMLCSGMKDRTRRCHCLTLYKYDDERKQCRGDYRASCRNDIDCQANLICNKTTTTSQCLCQLNYRYYPLLYKCRGDPGAICESATAECTDNAECRDGVCECAFQFIPYENKICVDPCPKVALNPVRIRYPGNCRRFIDCQRRLKTECPEMTIFNFRTQLCDYPKNVFDCR